MKTNSHPVILNSVKDLCGMPNRFFTPLRCVQNDRRKPSKIFLSLFLLFFSLSSPLLSHAETVDKVIATVNQEPITLYELNQSMENISKELNKKEGSKTPPKRQSPGAEVREKALQHLIDEALLSQEVTKQKIEVSDKDVTTAMDNILKRNNLTVDSLKKELASKGVSLESYKQDLREQLKRFRFINQVVGTKVHVNDEEVQEFYEKNFDKFKSSSEVQLSQIILPLSPTAPDAEFKKVKAQAEDVFKKAKANPANFDQLATQVGASGSGDLGKINLGSLSPQLVQAIQALNVGEISEPVRTGQGFVLVKLTNKEKSEKGFQGGEQAKEEIRNRIFEIKMQEELVSYIDQLKSKAFIQIKE